MRIDSLLKIIIITRVSTFNVHCIYIVVSNLPVSCVLIDSKEKLIYRGEIPAKVELQHTDEFSLSTRLQWCNNAPSCMPWSMASIH